MTDDNIVDDGLAASIRDAALASGYDDCGIISLDDMDGFKDRIKERIRNSPTSAVVYRTVGDLTGIKERFPWARAVVICTYWIGRYRFPKDLQGRYAKSFLLSPENPVNPDAHSRLGILERWFTDNGIRYEGGEQFGHLSIGPLRHAAMMAGLGIIRKNNFFYTEKGSFVNLTGYVIDRECTLYRESGLKPCPESCDLCRKACKTKALKGPYSMSPLRCISFWTTFGKGMCPPYLRKKTFEEWICGCDACQDACPHNRKHDWNIGEDYPHLTELTERLQPENLLEHPDDRIVETISQLSAHHLDPKDAKTVMRCAKRSLSNRAAVED